MSSEQENKRKKSSEEVFKQINGVEFYATKAILYSLYKQGNIAIAFDKDNQVQNVLHFFRTLLQLRPLPCP